MDLFIIWLVKISRVRQCARQMKKFQRHAMLMQRLLCLRDTREHLLVDISCQANALVPTHIYNHNSKSWIEISVWGQFWQDSCSFEKTSLFKQKKFIYLVMTGSFWGDWWREGGVQSRWCLYLSWFAIGLGCRNPCCIETASIFYLQDFDTSGEKIMIILCIIIKHMKSTYNRWTSMEKYW